MPSRQREFAEIRNLTGSRCISQTSQTKSIIDRMSFQASKQLNQDCVGCFNKNMAKSKKDEQIRKKEHDNKYYADNFKKIQATKDLYKQHRQKMLKQASEYNRSLAASQRESVKNLKRVESQQVMEQIKEKQQEFDTAEQSFKKSRIELKDKYKDELRNQLYSQRSMKQSQLTQSRISDNLSSTTNLKLIEESEKHHNKMKEQHKKCQQLNKSLILQKSYRNMEQRQQNTYKEKEHIKRVEEQFTKFTEFQGSNNGSQSNKLSLSISASSRTLNPEDVFTQLKRIQTEKKLSKIEERNQKHTQRMMDLKKLQEERKIKMQNKISAMKSYKSELANQVFEKKEQKAKQRQQALWMPRKSKVDYHTQQAAKVHAPCGSCSRVVQKKFIN